MIFKVTAAFCNESQTNMLKMYYKKTPLYILLLFTAVIMHACSGKSPQPIVNANEIKTFLAELNTVDMSNKHLENINNRIQFLNRKMEQDNSGPVTAGLLAGALSQRFEETGNISDIITADSLLLVANRKFNGSKTQILQSLSINALKRHEFKASLEYAYNAYILGEHKSISAGMLFDVYIETGNYLQAVNILNDIGGRDEYSYLIRASKLKQSKGDIDSSIIYMKMALETARKNTGSAAEYNIKWTENNLAMLYFTNEDFETSYDVFMNSLNRDKNNYKALEGIAFIAAAHDKNFQLAEEILLYLSLKLQTPDPYLNLYKISKLAGNTETKKGYLDEFIKRTQNPQYGKMYNRYFAEIYAEEFRDFDKAKEIAFEEIAERPTPSSYYLLAWINSKQGDNKAAVDIIKNFVEGKTNDPTILIGIEKIYFEETKKM